MGPFGLDTLKASTRALASTSPADAVYNGIEAKLAPARRGAGCHRRADAPALLGAAFGGQPVNVLEARLLIRAAQRLLRQAAVLGS